MGGFGCANGRNNSQRKPNANKSSVWAKTMYSFRNRRDRIIKSKSFSNRRDTDEENLEGKICIEIYIE